MSTDDRPMSSLNLVKFGPRIPDNHLEKVPLKIGWQKMCEIINNSVMDCSILLRFCTEFEHMMLDALQMFMDTESMVKLTA